MEETANRVFTEKELAKYLGVSYWTVRDWRLQENDPLPTVGYGRVLYRLKTVEAWLAKSEERNAKSNGKRKRKQDIS